MSLNKEKRMAKRLRAMAGAAVLVVLPSLVGAQAPGRISVSYQAAPVSDVVSGFARFSHQQITVAPDVGARLISGDIENGEWLPALDQLLGAQGLVARPDSGGALRVEAEQPITVEFQDAPLSGVLRSISAFARRSITMAPGVGDPSVSFTARSVDWQRALDSVLRDNGLAATSDASGNLVVVRR
jgi:ferric-dicitrate binding protein FerR (iron transport regulator)